MVTGHLFEKVINGPAHHTLHHLYFTVNYGQVSYLPTWAVHTSFIDILVVLYVGRPCRWLLSPATVRTGSSTGRQGSRRQEGILTTYTKVQLN
jgi:hypothetical protein